MHTVESNAFFTTGFSRRRVMVILRGYDPAETVRLAQRAWDAGIALVEVPLQSTEAASAISALARAANGTDRVESNPDVACVAAPVRNPLGTCVAAMSISVPTTRWREDAKGTLAALAQEGARELSVSLGARA